MGTLFKAHRLDDDGTAEVISTMNKLAGQLLDPHSAIGVAAGIRHHDYKNTVLVANNLVKASCDVVPLNYLLRESDGSWRIVDVYLDAKYSELALKRSEYSSVVSREGFDALIGIMENKIATMALANGS